MSDPFITRLAKHIKTHYDLKKTELTVVFPNKRAAFYLRSKFKEIYAGQIWLPQMLSIEEAMTQWSGIQLVDTVDMLFELISIDSDRHDNSIKVFGSMAAQMTKDFDEIDQYGVDAEYLFSYITELVTLNTWNPEKDFTKKEKDYLHFFEDLKRYYDQLHKRLDGQKKGYYGMITRYLAQLPDDELDSRTQGKSIIFAGFNALTPTERTIIDKLYKNGRTEVIWDFDRYYVDDKHNEAGRFAREYIEQNVRWKPTVFSNDLVTHEKKIHLVKANGNTIQAKALQSLLQVEEAPNVAVILADEKLMIPVLNSIPDKECFDHVNVSMGYPLKQTALDHLVMDFFTLHRKGRKVKDRGWYLWPILRIFDAEIVQIIFNKEEIDALNNYRAFIANKYSYIFNENTFNQYCDNADLQKFVKLLLNENDTWGPEEWIDALRTLLVFIADKVQRSTPNDSLLFLLNQVSETGKAVNRLKDLLKTYPNYVTSFDELEILYQLVSSNTNIKLNGSTTTGLQLMGLLETRNLDFSTYYMVGVNEGILPAGKNHNSFIPYSIRHECGLPDDREKQAVYAYHFYRLLQNADKTFFIYNTNSGESGGEQSRFLLQIKHELKKQNPKIHLYEESFTHETRPNTPPKLLQAHKTEEVMQLLMNKLQPEHDYQALAPTSLSAYIQCPFKFYLKYLMQIQDNSIDEETQNNVIGTVVHDTLQSLYENHLNTLLTAALFTSTIKPSKDSMLEAVIRKHFAQGLPDVGYNYLNKTTINRLLDNYLQYEDKEVKSHEITILGVEQLLTTTLEVDGIPCKISGKADRIDYCGGKIRIIDYKTGHIEDSEVKVPALFDDLHDLPEKALQLLIYKYLYLKTHQSTKAKDVTAALFGLRNKQVCFSLNNENDALENDFIGTMERLLTEKLRSMMNRSEPFSQPTDSNVKPCHFCDFKAICANTEAGERLADDR